MNSVENEKESKRKELKKKRKEITREEVLKKSEIIHNKILDLPEFQTKSTISIYVAKKEANEVETEKMIKAWREMGKKILVPLVDGPELKLSLLKDFEKDLEKRKFGVKEPKENKIRLFPIENLEMIFVPGLGFDVNGNRLGYGKGYYDRLLKKAPSDTDFIALAFDFQIFEEIPHSKKDIPVHKIVTEKRIINTT